MGSGLFWVCVAAAISIGSIHSLAPDHWVPFAALARAQRWPAPRTTRITLLCGFGHVTVSVLLGLLGLVSGRALLTAFGQRMESVAGITLIVFGLAYGAWGLRRAAGKHLHGHAHLHYDHVHQPEKLTPVALFLLFSADPCVAVIPLLFAAAPLGTLRTAGVVLAYELATLGTMVALALLAARGLAVLRFTWISRWGHAAAGGAIAGVGLVVTALGW